PGGAPRVLRRDRGDRAPRRPLAGVAQVHRGVDTPRPGGVVITVSRRYTDLVSGFRWAVPEEFNFGALVDAWATDRSRVALYWEDEAGRRERHTFWDVKQASNRCMNALAGLGVGRGDPLMVMLPRVPAWQAAIVGGLKLGALVIPCTASLRAKDIAYRARQGGLRRPLRPLDERRAGLHVQRPLRPRARARPPRALRGVGLLRAAHRVPPPREAGLEAPPPAAPPPLHRRGRAAQPRGDPRLARCPGAPDPRRLRADRDDPARREPARPPDPPRLDGEAVSGPRPAGDRRGRRGAAARRGRRARAARPPAVTLPRVLEEPRGDGGVSARRVVLDGGPGETGRRWLPLVRRA